MQLLSSSGTYRYPGGRIKCGRGPAAGAGRRGTDEIGAARLRLEFGFDVLPAGLRIDAGDQVLDPHVLGEHVPAVGAVDGIEDRHLAAGDQQFGGLAVDRHGDQRLFERPVQIPDIAVHVLVVPGELAGIRIERHRRIRVQRIVVRQTLPCARGDQQGADVVGIAGAEVHEVQVRIIAADRPHAGTEALVHRRAVPAVARRAGPAARWC